ncbi:MAG TPA: N-acetylmuramoyl-L-alanine amidase [Vicinamibacterales bacterium]|nr:N-acetylmuramoyl-L-alanine amidase [Vicinamibacterales bacterium]
MTLRTGALIVAAALMLTPAPAVAQPARDLYARALARERELRGGERPATLQQIRGAIAAYERVVHRHPASGYADNALWQGGNLALWAFERFGETRDRNTGERLLRLLKSDYASSSLRPRVDAALAAFNRQAPRRAASRPISDAVPAVATEATVGTSARGARATSWEPVTIRAITRSMLPDGVRVSIEMDRELLFRHEQIENPRRLFFDLRGARPAPELLDAKLSFTDDVVREIRLGRHPQQTVRVVMDTEGVAAFSVFTLYDPYRLIVDFRRAGGAVAAGPAPVATSGPITAEAIDETAPVVEEMPAKVPLISRPVATLPSPAIPAMNSSGQFSLARQLGLGVSRIVIDAGHGGHDPGARGNGLSEAAVVLDVAQRLKKLLDKQPGVDVAMTRDSDVFVPLEERTAIANRLNADLFLSIHANASRNTKARGVETYFLNFATNPEAEAVAARENSASGRTMHNLPDIVRAIALNNKINESRDFAGTVQKAMVERLSAKNRDVRNLGVKQAPFVVLIGAGMPSVLAEISFVTNKEDGQLLKSAAYRQTIAEALLEAILRYQRSLKARTSIAMGNGR